MSVSHTPRIGALGVFLLVTLFAFSGCSSSPSNDDRNSRYTLTAFGNSKWTLVHWVSDDGKTQLISTSPRTLNIGYSGNISGNAGVNNYTTTVRVNSGSLVWTPPSTTRMTGAEEAMDQEAHFLKDLQATTHLTVRGDRLLVAGEKPLRLEFKRIR